MTHDERNDLDEARERFTDRLAGEMDEREVAEFDMLLAKNRKLRDEFGKFRETWTLFEESADDSLPPSSSLFRELARHEEEQEELARTSLHFVQITLVGAIVVALAGFLLYWFGLL